MPTEKGRKYQKGVLSFKAYRGGTPHLKADDTVQGRYWENFCKKKKRSVMLRPVTAVAGAEDSPKMKGGGDIQWRRESLSEVQGRKPPKKEKKKKLGSVMVALKRCKKRLST